MKKRILLGVAAFGFAAVLFTSCAKMPQVEIDSANVAIEEVKATGAELYVQDSFIALQDSMKSALESIEAQKSKLFKNYDAAKEKLIAVAQQAQAVKEQVEVKKEEMKKEIAATTEAIKTLLAENNELVTKAPKGKEGATALIEIKSELATIEASLTEISSLLESGDLINSLNKANAAKEQATSINTELNDVIAKYKGKK